MNDLLSVAVIGPFIIFTTPLFIIWVVLAYRFKEKKAIASILEAMIAKGEPVTPATIQALGIRPRSPITDLRTGVILITSGLAFLLLGVFIGEEEAIRGLSGLAMFPLLIGIAYVGLWKFVGRKEPTNLG